MLYAGPEGGGLDTGSGRKAVRTQGSCIISGQMRMNTETAFQQRIEAARLATLMYIQDPGVQAVAVIGSTARRWFDEKSDVDILVVADAVQPEIKVESPFEITISFARFTDFEFLLRTEELDLVELRSLANLATGYALIDRIGLIDACQAANRRCRLAPEIHQQYSTFLLRCLDDLQRSSDAVEKKLLVSRVVNTAATLVLAASEFRVTKPRWAWRSIQTFAPDLAAPMANALGLVYFAAPLQCELLRTALHETPLPENPISVNARYLSKIVSTAEAATARDGVLSLEAAYLKDLVINKVLDASNGINRPAVQRLRWMVRIAEVFDIQPDLTAFVSLATAD